MCRPPKAAFAGTGVGVPGPDAASVGTDLTSPPAMTAAPVTAPACSSRLRESVWECASRGSIGITLPV